MDTIITPDGTAPLTNMEIELMGALISGTIPDWFQGFLESAEHSPGETEARTLDPQAQDTASTSTSSDVSAGGNTPSSTLSAIPNVVPLQAVGALPNHTDFRDGEKPHFTLPDSRLPPNNIPNVGKRRLSDPDVRFQAKRVRQLNINTELQVQAGQHAFGPQFLGPGTWYPPQPAHFFFPPPLILPPRYFPGDPTAVHAAYSSVPVPVMMPQAMFAAPNSAYYRPVTFGAPLHAGDYSVQTPYGDALQVATPAPPPFAAPEPFTSPEPSTTPEQKQQVTVMQPEAPRRKTRGERLYTIQPPARPEVEDSPDAAHQRTIDAHRVNDARKRDTDDIICLWTEPGAGSQPCHCTFRGTEALLAHCVDQHGVSRSKDLREEVRCGWADCAFPEMMKGALKRHLAESQYHARRGRIRKAAKTVKADGTS